MRPQRTTGDKTLTDLRLDARIDMLTSVITHSIDACFELGTALAQGGVLHAERFDLARHKLNQGFFERRKMILHALIDHGPLITLLHDSLATSFGHSNELLLALLLGLGAFAAPKGPLSAG